MGTMESMQIWIPQEMKDYLHTEATKHGFQTPNEYVQSVLADLQKCSAERKAIEALLLEGVRSPTVDVDEAFWAERRRKVLERTIEQKP